MLSLPGADGVAKLLDAAAKFKPTGTVNRQKACEALVARIKAANLPIQEECALIANAYRIMIDYANQSDIVACAMSRLERLDERARTKEENDWLSRFMDEARNVSDEKMQKLWGSLLAEELERPGHAPAQAVHVLMSITQEDVERLEYLFSHTAFCFVTSNGKQAINYPIVIDWRGMSEDLETHGIVMQTLLKYQTIGLIGFEPERSLGFLYNISPDAPSYIVFRDAVLRITGSSELRIGSILITAVGHYFRYIICGPNRATCTLKPTLRSLWPKAEDSLIDEVKAVYPKYFTQTD